MLRNPELIRLTGKHPFNFEAALTTLFESVCQPYSDILTWVCCSWELDTQIIRLLVGAVLEVSPRSTAQL